VDDILNDNEFNNGDDVELDQNHGRNFWPFRKKSKETLQLGNYATDEVNIEKATVGKKNEGLHLANAIDKVNIKKATISKEKKNEGLHQPKATDKANIKKAKNRQLSILVPAMLQQEKRKKGEDIERLDIMEQEKPDTRQPTEGKPTQDSYSKVSEWQLYFSTSPPKAGKEKLMVEENTTGNKSIVAHSSKHIHSEKKSFRNEKSIGEPTVSSLAKVFLGLAPFSIPLP